MLLTNTNITSSTPTCTPNTSISHNNFYSPCFTGHHFANHHHTALNNNHDGDDDGETESEISDHSMAQDYMDCDIEDERDSDIEADPDGDLYYQRDSSSDECNDLMSGDSFDDEHLSNYSNYDIQISYSDNLELAELANNIEISFEEEIEIMEPNASLPAANSSGLRMFIDGNFSTSINDNDTVDEDDVKDNRNEVLKRKPRISFCEFASVKSFDQSEPAHWIGCNKHRGDLDLKSHIFRTIHLPRNSPTKLWCALKMLYYKLPCNLAGSITTLSRQSRYDPSYLARMSIDGWSTFRQVTARPAESSNCGRYNFFVFSFPIDDLCCFKTCIDFELAIYCYRSGTSLEYIDDNNGKYYRGHIELTPIERESMCPLKLPAPCKNLGEMICDTNVALTNHIFQL